jgi:CRISPR-associated protein Cas1
VDENLIKNVPIEDIGLVVLDNQQITITQTAMVRLIEDNVAVVVCDDTHHPAGIFYNLEGNSLQSQKFQVQIEASQPLKKQLWQQTIVAKIQNQARLLKQNKVEIKYLENLIKTVKSGDSDNNEAKAASFYWKRIFPTNLEFTRDRYGPQPNNLLNYGYAILRAMVARALVGSGLMPTLGINHKNQYNAFCLADDIMEPYRPFVDKLVCEIIRENGSYMELSLGIKRHLLTIPAMDVHLEGKRSPMINAISRTTASLVRCFEGSSRKILYPELK